MLIYPEQCRSITQLKLKALCTEKVQTGFFIREICKVLTILVVTAHQYGAIIRARQAYHGIESSAERLP